MSPEQKAASIHLAFVFMTIQGRGQQQVRPTEIHRDYFVDVGCLCSDGVFYNRLLKPCRSLFVLVSWQNRLEHRNCCGFPGSLLWFRGCFLSRKGIASPPSSFCLKVSTVSKMQRVWFRLRPGKHPLGCQVCSPAGAGTYFSAGAFPSHRAGKEQVPHLAVPHQSQLLATASPLYDCGTHMHPSQDLLRTPLCVPYCGGFTLATCQTPTQLLFCNRTGRKESEKNLVDWGKDSNWET